MPPPSRACHTCATPLPGETRYCGVCGTATSAGPPGFPADPESEPADELDRVRRGLAGRYAIDRVVGTGGTATVYLAEDLRHRRQVAVKVLRPEIATLVGSARFLREIEIAARLQHPRILPVYDSGEAAPDGAGGARVLFYVMPFAAESLASRLERGPVPLADAVRILSQLADALAFAHAHGVVHRDIKPDNVMLSGRHAMIADFGIAKALAVPLAQPPRTRPGVPMGTPYYMAPEQVAGDPEIDGRADQYALGVVGYELLAGRRPFTGATVQEILAAQVLESPEPLEVARPDLPPALARVVMRCLEKDRGHRWERTDELAEHLETLALGSATPPEVLPAGAPAAAPSRLRRAAAAGALVSLLAGALVLGHRSAPPAPVPMSEQVSFSGAIGMATISPDGRFLAYSSRDEGTLLIQEMAGGPPLEIARGFTRVLALRWSPDGTRLLAGGSYEGEPGIYVVPRLGGPLRRIPHGRLGQWHPDGSRLSLWDHPDKSVRLVDLATGDSLPVALPGSYDWLYDAEWSPGGDRLAYVTMNEPDRYTLRVVSGDGTSRTLLQDSLPLGSPRWSPGQDALYYLRGAAELRVLRLERSGAPGGDPVTLVDGLQAGPSEVAGVAVPFTITADGRRMIYLRSLDYANIWQLASRPLAAGGSFTTRRLTTGTAIRRGVAVSPDRRWIAYLETSKDGTDLFRMPIGGGPAQRLTFTARVASRQAAWSPDGSRLAFGAHEAGAVRLGTVGAAGGETRMLRETSLPAMGDVAWTPGGWIMHQATGNRNFRLTDPEGGTSRWLVPEDTTGWIFAPHPSPDGQKVAVYWNRRPQSGVWVVSLRDTTPRLLAEGRLDPVGWSADGRSVLAVGADGGNLIRLGLDGRTDTVGALPFRTPDCVPAAADTLVCAVPERVSDVWMISGFDPGRR